MLVFQWNLYNMIIEQNENPPAYIPESPNTMAYAKNDSLP